MKTRIIHTKVWKDTWFVGLSQQAKILWLYLLTNEKINISGIYELTDREILFDTSINIKELDKTKEELQGKAIFYKDWVYIPNVDKYNSYRNSPKNEIAYAKEVSYVPLDVLQYFVDTSIDTSIYTDPILLEIINKKSEIINHKSKTRNKKSEVSKEDIQEVKDRLYEEMGWK